MKNVFWYLGFLSPLSLLYFVNGNVSFLSLALSLLYFTFYNEDDERLRRNEGLACRNAFVFVILVGIVSMIYWTLTQDNSAYAIAAKSTLAGSIIVSILSYHYYNFKEERPFKQKSKNTEKNSK